MLNCYLGKLSHYSKSKTRDLAGLEMISFLDLASAMEGVRTRRVSLRAARPADGWHLFEATRNKFFNRYLMWSRPSEPYEAVARMESIVSAHEQGHMAACSIMENSTGRWVGLFRFLRYRHDPEVVEISLWIHSDFFHAAYGYEVVATSIARAFSASPILTIVGASFPNNRGAQSIMKRCGFSFHSTRPRPHEDGHSVDLMEYRITRLDWENESNGTTSVREESIEPAIVSR